MICQLYALTKHNHNNNNNYTNPSLLESVVTTKTNTERNLISISKSNKGDRIKIHINLRHYFVNEEMKETNCQKKDVIFCQVKEVEVEYYSESGDNDEDEDDDNGESEWMCIEQNTNDFYRLNYLPKSFVDKHGFTLSLGSTWIRINLGPGSGAKKGILFNKGTIFISSVLHEINPNILQLASAEENERLNQELELQKLNIQQQYQIDQHQEQQKQTRRLTSEGTTRKRDHRVVLLVRANAIDSDVSVSSEELHDSFFGSEKYKVNLKSQFNDCSYGDIKFVKASGWNIDSFGVVTLNTLLPVSLLRAQDVENIVQFILRARVGPLFRFDHVVIVLPPKTASNFMAYAYKGGIISCFKDVYATYLSGQMHEIGKSNTLFCEV